jgi:hypothetical protein
MFVTREPGSNSDGLQVHSDVLWIVNGLITVHSVRLGEQLLLKGIIGHAVSTSYSYELHKENIYMPICCYAILRLHLRNYSGLRFTIEKEFICIDIWNGWS